MIRLKNLLTESTTPDFSTELNALKSEVQQNMKKDGKDQQEIDSILTLIDKAKSSLAKHYVSMWKNKIPKEMPNLAINDYPIFQQQVHIISVTKDWIRKVVTDVAPSISWSDKWKLKIAWPLADWEDIDRITFRILYSIERSITGVDSSSELEQQWIQWGIFYLVQDRDFAEEMFDILVD